jgi:hypothetical protein
MTMKRTTIAKAFAITVAAAFALGIGPKAQELDESTAYAHASYVQLTPPYFHPVQFSGHSRRAAKHSRERNKKEAT